MWRLLCSLDDGFTGCNVSGERLLAKDVLVGLDGADGLRSVLCGDASDADRLKTRVLEHLVEVLVDLGAVGCEVLQRPGTSFWVGIAGCDQLCARSLLEEVFGVASAHAAEARDGDLELANHCAWM